jgi:iron(III) transport system substrate-binding protein
MGKTTRRAVLGGVVTTALVPARATAQQPAMDKAKAQGRVMLYTSLDTKLVDAIIAAFTNKYGVKVEYYRGGSADVTGKTLAEADAGRTQADVIDASDLGAFLAMQQRGLLQPYRSATTASIAANLRDPGFDWVADRLTQCVIQYNTKEFGAAPPTSWADLATPRFKGRLVFFSSENGDGAPRLYTLAKYFGWDLLKRLADNKPLRVQTPQLATQVLESGERGCAFATNDNIAWRSKLQGKTTDYLFPQIGVPTEPGGVALVAKSVRPDAAMLFYDWWMGDAGQKLLIDGGKYSSRTDLPPPKANPPLASLKLLTIDYAEYQKNRSDILQRMTDTFGGEWGV